MSRPLIATVAGALFALGAAGPALADGGPRYLVTVTNLTSNQTFTPILVASHTSDIRLFKPGAPAGGALEALAESGDVGPLKEVLGESSEVLDVNASDGPLHAGESVTVSVATKGQFRRISLAAMLVPTNDAFVSVDSLAGPFGRGSRSTMALAWDAGTEINDELCDHIPAGGGCAGEGVSEADGEGFVHIHRGIHGVGDLRPAAYDWRNPVARVTVRRVTH